MTKEELNEMMKTFIKENLTIESRVKTTSTYVGDMSGGESLYQDTHTLTVSILLDGEVISETESYL